MRNRLAATLLILSSLALLNGSGQKGPLYLPKPEKQELPAQTTDDPETNEN